MSEILNRDYNEARTHNKGIASKRGRTLKHQQFASLYFCSGWTLVIWL